MKLFEFSTAVLVAALLGSIAWDAQAQVSISDADSKSKAIAAPYQAITIEAPKLLERQTLYSPPDLVIPAAPATAPCRIAIGGGFSIPWGGLGGNGSVEDEKCTRRENARILDNCHTNSCIAVMCSDSAVSAAIPKVCNAARQDVGYWEAQQPKTYAVEAQQSAPLAAGSCPGYTGKDPIVLKRMGCL